MILRGCCLICINLLWKPNIFFQTNKRGFNSAINITFICFKCGINAKTFSFISLVFVSPFVVLKVSCELFVSLMNPGIGILINLILNFSDSIFSRYYFRKWWKCFLANKIESLCICRFLIKVHPNIPIQFLFVFIKMSANGNMSHSKKNIRKFKKGLWAASKTNSK